MKAMVLQQFHAPLRWQEAPEPEIGSRDVLIKVVANGLCATDLKIADGLVPTVPLPHIPGHEAAGEVVEVGVDVPGLQPGDHVTVYPTEGCGFCDYCRRGLENYCVTAPRTGFEINGGFSQYMRVSGRNAVKVSPEVPWEDAAIIPDAIASVYHALTQKARVQAGETVVIIGIGGLGHPRHAVGPDNGRPGHRRRRGAGQAAGRRAVRPGRDSQQPGRGLAATGQGVNRRPGRRRGGGGCRRRGGGRRPAPTAWPASSWAAGWW